MSFKAVGFGGGGVTVNPANVEHVLKPTSASTPSPKGELTVSMDEDLLGSGIFNSDGDRWLWQRKAASHEFSTGSLTAFVAGTVRFEAAERLLPLLTRAARRASPGATGAAPPPRSSCAPSTTRRAPSCPG